ncbi:HAD family hydrolase [Arthrobacter agilis]|uniref:HAD family hydrolase n=1 Tax=Arthrobacter agilis TaxID=37921 RepID=UPI002365E69B|nr:HAD family hydrolase [Arthrobacter agilis]WDF32169.1 HAD family hydrolase [Arthrobacter agilis]
MAAETGAGRAGVTASPVGEVAAVLFDIDDTLVDLERAMGRTLQSIPDPALDHLGDDDWVRYKALYTADPQRHYDRFLAGELTFEEQRVHRVRHARAGFTPEPFLGSVAEAWVCAYEQTLPLHFRAYDDVVPLLDALDDRGIPYGAVSNNVHDYQRAKLDRAELQRIRVLVGIDTVGVAKPEPAIYREGARLLHTDPARTLYVGDNLVVDAQGARAAGLVGVWLDRAGGSAAPGAPSSAGRSAAASCTGTRDAGTGEPGDASGSSEPEEVPRIGGLDAVLQFLPSVR